MRKTQKKLSWFCCSFLSQTMSDTKLNDEPDTYPDTYLDWITSLKSKEIIRSMWTRMSLEERKEFWDEDDKNKEEEEQEEEEYEEEEYEEDATQKKQ